MQCHCEWVSKWRNERRAKLLALFGGKCVRCGYDKYIGALCFHHRNPEEKEFILNQRVFGRSWEELVMEAKKCDILCANCHAEEHGGIS